MHIEDADFEAKILEQVTRLLDGLGPFTPQASREEKWRTTEQLATALDLPGSLAIDKLDQILQRAELVYLQRLEAGLPAEAAIRRAKYPDRTTALTLWGSAKHLGPPWPENRPDRSDPPDDIPATLRVPDTAPQVFLSHTHQDLVLALRLAEALASMEIGCWRFETHIEQRGSIAECVRKAIDKTACMVALVTRHSIASLWVLTELHTSMISGVPVTLVVDTGDELLLKLFQTVRFPNIEWFHSMYLPVEYDKDVVSLLKQDYAAKETDSRTQRYADQVRDFLATLPMYLGNVPPGKQERVWRPVLSFPRPPAQWSGFIKLGDLAELRARIDERTSGIG